MSNVKKNKESLNNWLYHYNPYNKTWNAFKREDLQGYFSGSKKVQSKIITSKKISVVIKKMR